MPRIAITLICLLGWASGQALAWSNHTYPAYRVFENMPEVAQAAPVSAERLEVFLKAQEKTIESLLLSQELWAQNNLAVYPPRPAPLTFKANPIASDAQRRAAFLNALRVAPNSRFALYIQPDPVKPDAVTGKPLPHALVDTLPEQPNSQLRFIEIKAGDKVAPLHVLASATDEPDYGLDINLWDDSPSDWGKTYGFGALPFGNPALYFSTQAPFHMGFFHEDRVIYLAAPFVKKTFPMMRVQQYTGLAALAFKTGHPYWGWRFTGLALHYLQDLTQPYHASLSPGNGALKLIGINALAMAGFPRLKEEMIVLLSNRHLALEKYQNQLIFSAAQAKQDTAFEQSLRNTTQDTRYPAWSELYTRDVVSRQAHALAPQLVERLLAALPKRYVSDPSFDFGVHESGIDLLGELKKQDSAKLASLNSTVSELMGNFGAHSRNLVRGVLKAGTAP